MNFLKDPRIQQYRQCNSIKKFVSPTNYIDEKNPFDNPFYVRLKQQFLQNQQKRKNKQQKIRQKQNNQSRLELKKFLLKQSNKSRINRNNQKIKRINNFFDNKIQNIDQSTNHQRLKSSQNFYELKKDCMKCNSLTNTISSVQSGLINQQQKILLLDKYTSLISNHYQKYKIDQQASRFQRKQYEQFVNLFLDEQFYQIKKQNQDGNLQYRKKGKKKIKNIYKQELQKKVSFFSSSKIEKQSVKRSKSFLSSTIQQADDLFSATECKKKIEQIILQFSRQIVNSQRQTLQSKKINTRPTLIKSKSIRNIKTSHSKFYKQTRFATQINQQNSQVDFCSKILQKVKVKQTIMDSKQKKQIQNGKQMRLIQNDQEIQKIEDHKQTRQIQNNKQIRQTKDQKQIRQIRDQKEIRQRKDQKEIRQSKKQINSIKSFNQIKSSNCDKQNTSSGRNSISVMNANYLIKRTRPNGGYKPRNSLLLGIQKSSIVNYRPNKYSFEGPTNAKYKKIMTQQPQSFQHNQTIFEQLQ